MLIANNYTVVQKVLHHFSLISDFNNLQTDDVKLIGLKLLAFALFPFLKIGIILAFFHSLGIFPFSND